VIEPKDDEGVSFQLALRGSAAKEADESHKVDKVIKHKEGLDPENILSERKR
jgi:hypothetical protein